MRRQRTIECSGKSGIILRFTYSEFKDDLARDSFTREFQVDLDEIDVVAYKGAILNSLKFKSEEHPLVAGCSY